MLHLLDALQTLEQGGARVLLSYQSLDVEQIGHVYEGLLDHTALRITDPALALAGKLEPELALSEIDDWAAAGTGTLTERLAKGTGRSAAAITKALGGELADEHRSRLRAACGNDDALLARVEPYHALLREDLRGDPLVFLAGIAVRHPGARPPHVGHLLHAPIARRGGRPPRARPGRLRPRPGPGERPRQMEAEDGRAAAGAQDRRHRDGVGRVPRRLLPLPRRQAARGVDREVALRARRCRPTRSNAKRSRTA